MQRVNILLIDDNPDHRHLLGSRLRHDSEGRAEVATASDVSEASERLGESSFDAIVIDYNLPDGTGCEMLKQVQQAQKELTTLVISSSDRSDTILKSFRAGTEDFLPKREAIRPGVLWKKLDELVAKRRQARQKRRATDREMQKLIHLSETDALTGLYNRRFFEQLCTSPQREEDRRPAAACLMFDIDHFKRINDTYGHAIGDEAIRYLSRLLGEHTGEHDIVVRWGGEEFLVIRRAASLSAAWLWAEHVMDQLRAGPVKLTAGDKTVELPMTVSIGIALNQSQRPNSDLVAKADAALYLAKESGRNRVCTFEMTRIFDLVGREITPPAEAKPSETAADDPTFVQNARVLLSTLSSELGPTQREQVFDHGRRVGRLAGRLARAADQPRELVNLAVLTGTFHDIGKVFIPEELLAKAAALTPGERVVMDQHAELGGRLVEQLGGAASICRGTAEHHQPAREHPSLLAQIVSLADAYDALISPRPYRNAMRNDEAMQMLSKHTPGKFNAALVPLLANIAGSDTSHQSMVA